MGDFASTWSLTRGRFDEAVKGLSDEQLRWRLHPGTLTIGEMAIHVAGVEVSFISQLLDLQLDAEQERIRAASTDGAVNDLPFPFPLGEIDNALVWQALDYARTLVAPVIDAPNDTIRNKQIKSALGPIVSGDGAFARLAYHPGYHQGQVQMVKTSPGFPS